MLQVACNHFCSVLLFQCRENNFGREMYKLCIFNFLTTFCTAFLLNYPRKWVCLTSTAVSSLSHSCLFSGKVNVSDVTLFEVHRTSANPEIRWREVHSLLQICQICVLTVPPACLTGWCGRSTPRPCWPGCRGNKASWSHLTSWTRSTARRCPGWESTTALCCLW